MSDIPDFPPKDNWEPWKEAARQYHEERRADEEHGLVRLVPKLPEEPEIGLVEIDAGIDPGPIPPRSWLLSTQFCRGFISSLFAAGGVGKSALRLLQYIALATGKELSGQHIFRRSRVLLISLEDDYWELQRRIAAVLLHYHINRCDLLDWLFIANPVNLKLALKTPHRDRITGPLEKEIRAAVHRRQVDLVALDPFIKLHQLTENDSGDMEFVCGILVCLCVQLGIAVDVPHHVHKGPIEAGDADAGRGSSGIKDASRLTFTLTTMSSGEADLYSVAKEDRHGYVRLDSAKVNITARCGTPEWFRLIGVPLDNGTEIYPNGDTIQVAEPWLPPEIFRGLDRILIGQILDKIDAGLPDGTFYAPNRGGSGRAAWHAITELAPDKTKQQAMAIVNEWSRTELLIEFDYTPDGNSRPVKGLRVDNSKRP